MKRTCIIILVLTIATLGARETLLAETGGSALPCATNRANFMRTLDHARSLSRQATQLHQHISELHQDALGVSILGLESPECVAAIELRDEAIDALRVLEAAIHEDRDAAEELMEWLIDRCNVDEQQLFVQFERAFLWKGCTIEDITPQL